MCGETVVTMIVGCVACALASDSFVSLAVTGFASSVGGVFSGVAADPFVGE